MNEYKDKLAKLLNKEFGINLQDCLSDELIEDSFNNGETVEELVDWIGEKYGLTKLSS